MELINFCFEGGKKWFIATNKTGRAWAFQTKFNFFLNFVIICSFGKSLVVQCVLTQHLLWKIYFYIILTKKNYQILKNNIYVKHAFLVMSSALQTIFQSKIYTNFKNVYPSELQFEKENISTSEVFISDFSIII